MRKDVLDLQKKWERMWGWKIKKKKVAENLTKFGKKHTPTDSGSFVNHDQINPKKFLPKTVLFKLLGEKKSWKQPEKNETLLTGI